MTPALRLKDLIVPLSTRPLLRVASVWASIAVAAALAATLSGCRCSVAVCGDGFCDFDESPANCSVDCPGGPFCGDGSCNGGESCTTCAGDCGGCGGFCGDGSCDATEECSVCPSDCGACGGFCGDGFCDFNEDTTCADCTFEVGECLDTSITATDYAGADLFGAFGIYDFDIEGAFFAAKGVTYSFDDWCGPGCSTTWIGAYINSAGSITVRGTGSPADYTDWLMVCETPDGLTLFANDDYNTADCTGLGICDPGINLSGAGVWLCLFGAAPFLSTNSDPYGPIEICATSS